MKRMIRYFTTVTFLLFTQFLNAQHCDCKQNFNWVKSTFEKNDAGFADALRQKGTAAYKQHSLRIYEKTKKITDKYECATLLNEWLLFFRKAHLSASATGAKNTATSSKKAWPEIKFNEAELARITSREEGLEGIWITGNYKIMIARFGNIYKGIVTTSTNNDWKPNQLKLEIKEDTSGVYFMGDRSPSSYKKAKLWGHHTLQLGNVFLNRFNVASTGNESMNLYLKLLQLPVPFVEQLSAKTVLFRIPSFEQYQKQLIDSLLIAHKNSLQQSENLIIDIRNNGGGSDISYNNLLPVLYTNPIKTVGVELLSTPLNNTRMENFLLIPGLSENDKNEIGEVLQLLKANLEKYVNISGERVSTLKMDTVLPHPKSIAIIINENNGSTAEQFLLAAKQSKKVKLFGSSSMGVLDISNMHFVESPDKNIRLGYCLSRSLRLPGMPIDNIGIQPDYFIDADIAPEKWLGYVQKIMEE